MAARNHPCIVMWVVFNEGWGQYDTARIVEWIKKLRSVAAGRLTPAAGPIASVGDVHRHSRLSRPAIARSGGKRAAVLGEFGGLGLAIEGHTWEKKTWGYRGVRDKDDLTRKYREASGSASTISSDKPGLSAAIYTQITDVETEANGLLTYDRAVIKVDLEPRRGRQPGRLLQGADAQDHGSRADLARRKALPGDTRSRSPAKTGSSPISRTTTGKKAAAASARRVRRARWSRTEWKTDDIWLRRDFTLSKEKSADLQLLLHHDDDVEVYINGVLATKLKGYKGDYEATTIKHGRQGGSEAGQERLRRSLSPEHGRSVH